MVRSCSFLGLLAAATATIASSVSVVSGDCTFTPNCDYGKGSRASEPAATQADCCALCTNRPGCAAGVYDGTTCWFKTAKQVASGCQKSSRAKAACIPPSIKPGPPPPTPPTPPGPKPPPGPPKPPPPPPAPLPPLPPTPPSAKCATGEKPVQVFILMGQSNMLGEGKKAGTNNSLTHAVETDHKYPYLWEHGNWSVSKNVRNVFVMASGGMSSKFTTTLFHNEFMTGAVTTPEKLPGYTTRPKPSIGPELGIGFALGDYTTDPVMTLKSCIGDRALGWDLLPPGTPQSEFTQNNVTYVYAGYHDSPEKWIKGTKPVPIGWAAGIQYDGDLFRANNVLANISAFYPGSSCYEVAGFFWWQGDRDSRDMGLATHYEANLVQLIKQLRLQYNSPNAKFVTASLGQTAQGATDGGGLILDAMENVANPAKYPEFKGNVAAVYTHPLEHSPGSSGGHYGDDAYTYMNVGAAMGQAMVGLLKGSE